ncbi:MAG: ATP-binding protein [Gaiellaceae bacterium]
MAAVPVPQPELIGRDAELEAIESFLSRRGTDGPPALVLEGEAGIGKTTLWREGLAFAPARSYRVLAARPSSPELEMPFAGLADLVGEDVDGVLRQLPAPQRQALEIALLRAEPGSSPPRPHTIAAAVLSYLRELSRLTPVLIAIDDVQWLDSESVGAVEFALRRSATIDALPSSAAGARMVTSVCYSGPEGYATAAFNV